MQKQIFVIQNLKKKNDNLLIISYIIVEYQYNIIYFLQIIRKKNVKPMLVNIIENKEIWFIIEKCLKNIKYDAYQ